MRMCIDNCALNNFHVKNLYPVPRIDELLDCVQGAQVLPSTDMRCLNAIQKLIYPEQGTPLLVSELVEGTIIWTHLQAAIFFCFLKSGTDAPYGNMLGLAKLRG